ncbi:MAG TPA: VTT domain-containing protein [Vicinamibacteria bacterium]|jgi:membrane protein YqaA with SNARE-associated domain
MVWFRRLYDWVLHWAHTPYGTPALGVLSFAESSFFPVPPDPLLMALSLSAPRRAFLYATVASVCSVVGGLAGYAIGAWAWGQVGPLFFAYLGPMGFTSENFDLVQGKYEQNAFLAVFAAGFTPIPYKVFTVAAGVFSVSLGPFFIASVISRSARFFTVSGLIWLFGPAIKIFIDRYFNLLTVAFFLLLAGGFLVIKYLL